MCPKEAGDDPLPEGDQVEPSEPPAADPLEAFAVDAARRQAVERGEDADDVDTSFIARALSESRRMRGEAQKCAEKRAANTADVTMQHGEAGRLRLEAAMAEHMSETAASLASAAAASEAGAVEEGGEGL